MPPARVPGTARDVEFFEVIETAEPLEILGLHGRRYQVDGTDMELAGWQLRNVQTCVRALHDDAAARAAPIPPRRDRTRPRRSMQRARRKQVAEASGTYEF